MAARRPRPRPRPAGRVGPPHLHAERAGLRSARAALKVFSNPRRPRLRGLTPPAAPARPHAAPPPRAPRLRRGVAPGSRDAGRRAPRSRWGAPAPPTVWPRARACAAAPGAPVPGAGVDARRAAPEEGRPLGPRRGSLSRERAELARDWSRGPRRGAPLRTDAVACIRAVSVVLRRISCRCLFRRRSPGSEIQEGDPYRSSHRKDEMGPRGRGE